MSLNILSQFKKLLLRQSPMCAPQLSRKIPSHPELTLQGPHFLQNTSLLRSYQAHGNKWGLGPLHPPLPRPLGAHNMFIHTTPFRLYHYTSQKMSRGTPCSSTYTHTTMPTNAPYCSFHPCSTSTCNVSHSGPVVWPEYPHFSPPT